MATQLSSRSASSQLAGPVQLRVQTGAGGEIRRVLLTGTRLNVSCPPDTQFILVNEGGHGFYRVRYGPNLLKRMLEAGLEKLAPIERLNLVNDAWATTIAGLMPLSDYLDLTGRFALERGKNVWAVLLDSFAFLNRIIEPADRAGLESSSAPESARPLRLSVGQPDRGTTT